MRSLLLLHLSMLTFLLLTSCKKDEEDCFTTATVDATLVWTGDYAVDGCGYILYIGETQHKPANEQRIPDSYKTASPTEVEVRIINYGQKVNACMSGVSMNSIKVVSLRAR